MVAESIDDVPFDLQPLRVILYDKNHPAWGKKLRSAISASIRETIADTATAVPPMFRRVVKSSAPAEPETVARIASLEREVAAIKAGSKTRSRRDADAAVPQQLYNRLRHTKSKIVRVDLLRRAIESGMPLKLVEDITRSSMPPSTAQSTLAKQCV